MIAIPIITSLIGWVSEFMNGRPFSNSITLVGSNSPVSPEVTFAHVAFCDGIVESIVGDVI